MLLQKTIQRPAQLVPTSFTVAGAPISEREKMHDGVVV